MDTDPWIDDVYIFELPKLNGIEEFLISRGHAVMKVCRFVKGSVGHEGNVMDLEKTYNHWSIDFH